ncbi:MULTISPECIES: prephenate dehydratase [Curtobacterium]|jgi:prephenate dehydratase|uniref:Prephenate dehydratase n=1 Tax=Curtobacterium poinsettiae TaxID=159612 RepID=A0ABT3S5P1_9MICO|nr:MULTISPECIES: prephenate dehydratase [Curtobacterium]EYT65506.1 prephenate dehydratase [Curtobacterium flaccumfaciens UCD-AKU]KIQ02099.1 prephenate dehydratase [Curtobacterium flaccumfaciens]KQR31260.1 prephenate dehydratase [Curtobacterium sp. Leaf154]MBT1610636.1 prephenate dehydratase [Curtobacterium flaccumfaciens pv. poinsettiae]MCX2850148.1 prephenate dehydratase [Curtobacterium flaccumfaciens pv. poinsettiae]
MTDPAAPSDTYSYLGPAGTFTEAALKLVEAAAGKPWRSVNNVGEALDDVMSGRSVGAVIAIENSVDGGVSATQDALARIPGVRIVGEYLVPVDFVLVARPGTTLADVRTVNAHPVAYAQTHNWLEANLPGHGHIPASSNVAAALALLEADPTADAAVAPPGITDHHDVVVLASSIGDNASAVTRFVLVSKTLALPEPTGADKTSVIVELPADHPGALVDMLEQFATRGINMGLLSSRPIGDELGRYRFVIDLDGHVRDERVADALLGLRRFSPRVTFLGSYPRADGARPEVPARYSDAAFVEARDWLRAIVSGEPGAR